MNQTTISLQEKKDAINKYLNNHGYNGKGIIESFSESDTNEIYDLFMNNVIPATINRLYGFYATYYAVNKQFDKMIEYYVLAIEVNPHDNGAITELYKYISKHSYDQKHMDRILTAVKSKNKKIYNLYYQLSNSKKPIPTTQDKITQAINQHIQNNEMSKIYDMYPECKNTEEKTQYLSKVMILKDFKPTKEMINDLLTLDFSNASPDIHLIKSVFTGLKMNEISL